VTPPGFIIADEPAPERRAHPQRVEEARRDLRALKALGIVVGEKVGIPPGERGHVGDRAGAGPPVEEVRFGDGFFAVIEAGARFRQHHDRVGIAEGVGSQEQAVDEIEDGGVRAEPHRERHGHCARQERPLEQRAPRVLHVVQEYAHEEVS
jgi:hypothetical protein